MTSEFDEKEFYEGVPKTVSFTGSTGVNPLQDGGIRATFLLIPPAVLFFLQTEYDILSTDGYAALLSLMAPAGILAWAFFDKFIRPRFTS